MRVRAVTMGLVVVVVCALPTAFAVRVALHRRRIAARRIRPRPLAGETDARSAKEENWRNRMAQDVVRRWVHPGMTRAQVVARLGPGQPLTDKEYGDWQGRRPLGA